MKKDIRFVDRFSWFFHRYFPLCCQVHDLDRWQTPMGCQLCRVVNVQGLATLITGVLKKA